MGVHSVLALILITITVITGIRSEEQNLYSEALKDVKAFIDPLIAPPDTQDVDDPYAELFDLLEGLDLGDFLLNVLNSGAHDNKTCQTCNEVFKLGKGLLQTPEILTVFGKSICDKGTGYTPRVCNGELERLAVPVVYIIQNTTLDTAEICGMLLHPDCMTHLEMPMNDKILWELSIPPKKDAFKPLAGDGKPLKMLQVSDFHLDLWYTAGANSRCNEPLCCRSTSLGNTTSAGDWGELNGPCDTPPHSALKYISQMAGDHPDIDLVIWNGDTVAHDIWNITKEVNLESVKFVSDELKKQFKNSIVIPTLGNHEAVPVNMFVPSDVPADSTVSMAWLYDTLADDYWSQWIPESSRKTFKRGGYYSKLVKPNLKAIVLNSNVCDRESYWIAYSPVDPDGQLKWLIEELEDSETKGLYTIIAGHVPPGDCYVSWFNNYLRIVERYEEVIVGSYFGHTHKDEFFVYYTKNVNTGEFYPLTHVEIPGSITTFTGINPNYKVYELDSTGRAKDYTSYYTDLSADNSRGADKEPVWQKLYSALDAYGLSDLSTKSWEQFITRAKTDDKLAELFYRNYHRNSDTFVKAHPGDNLAWKHRNIEDKKVYNPIYSMLPPIKSN